jgi:hypothetical protein
VINENDATALSLTNQSDQPVIFRYMANLLMHVDVFTARGKQLDMKMGAPIFEMPAPSIPLKPGEKFEQIEQIQLSVWYDLAPGDYYLLFRYDLRLLPDPVMNAYRKKLHKDDWVLWDSRKYQFHVHR